jgi:hypothetical protein
MQLKDVIRTGALVAIALTVTLAGLVAACNRTPTTPSFIPRPQPPPSPSGPPPVVATSVELVGPRSVAPGGSVQFRAILHRSDGTTSDVTTTAQWRSSNNAVLSISSTGVATGLRAGDTFVSVSAQSRGSGREIIVVPDGTFRLVGLVGEADSPTTGVVGAAIDASGSTNATAVTDSAGRYRLYGVAGATLIRITKDGYQPQVLTVDITDHQTQNFVVAVTAPRPDLSGRYTLNIRSSDSCRNGLIEEARDRSYTALVTQQGPIIEVMLTGANFARDAAGKGDRFRGRLEPGQAVFRLSDYDYYYRYYPDVIEQISDSTFLTIAGSVTVGISSTRMSGALNGRIATLPRDPRQNVFPVPTARCDAASHQFELTR